MVTRAGSPPKTMQGFGKGAQGYGKAPAFVKADERGSSAPMEERGASAKLGKTDEELEAERKEARKRDEENSFKDVRVELCFFGAPVLDSYSLPLSIFFLFLLFAPWL